MEKPNLIVRFFSFLLKVLVVLVLMVVIAIASFEGVTYYLTGSLYDLRELAGGGNDITNIGSSSEEQETEIDETNMESTLFFVDSADSGKEYIALLPLEDETVLLYEYKEVGDEIELNVIEDDDEFDKVSNAFYDMYEDEE